MLRIFIMLIVLTLLVSLSSCSAFGKFGVKAELVRYGLQEGGKLEPIVSSEDDIKLYIGSSPSGFTLKDNELEVEEGYNHKIIGRIKGHTGNFEEDGQKYYGHTCRRSKKNGSNTVYMWLKKAAYKGGANAIIFAYSTLPEEITGGSACYLAITNDDFGGGWAVVLAEKEKDSAEETVEATAEKKEKE